MRPCNQEKLSSVFIVQPDNLNGICPQLMRILKLFLADNGMNNKGCDLFVWPPLSFISMSHNEQILPSDQIRLKKDKNTL